MEGEVRKHRNVPICPRAENPKWRAEQLREMILKECGVLAEMPSVPSDESLTFRWFVKERYIPMRQLRGCHNRELPTNTISSENRPLDGSTEAINRC